MYNQQQSSQPSSHHNVRLYIVTITVVIGGILFLLLLNNNPDGKFSLTSAVISAKNTSLIEQLNDNPSSNSPSEDIIPADNDKTNDISFTLTSTEIPTTQRGAKFQSLDLSFTNTGSTIIVNSDRLELNDLDQVNLGIRGFTGTLDFDGTKFGLEGTAHELEVNGITLSSNQEIKISFANLDYNTAQFADLEVADLEFIGGNGALTISDKFSYQLEEGQSILVDNYIGSVTASHGTETAAAFTLEGTARGVDVIGSTLNVNLR